MTAKEMGVAAALAAGIGIGAAAVIVGKVDDAEARRKVVVSVEYDSDATKMDSLTVRRDGAGYLVETCGDAVFYDGGLAAKAGLPLCRTFAATSAEQPLLDYLNGAARTAFNADRGM